MELDSRSFQDQGPGFAKDLLRGSRECGNIL